MGSQAKKQFMDLEGRPVLAYSLAVFQESPQVDDIFLVVPGEDALFCATDIVDRHGFGKVSRIVEGGVMREDSVYNALELVSEQVDTVLIHDGVRPFLCTELLDTVIRCCRKHEAVIPALGVWDTLKRVETAGKDGERVLATVSREMYRTVQTPQGFRRSRILEAYDRARAEGIAGTDDAYFVERLGVPVMVVPGSRLNMKITSNEDLLIARALLKAGMIT